MLWCNVSLPVALPANGNLMKTLYIVPTTASGTKHSVCTRKGLIKKKKKTLPADAVKANVIHSWCNPRCNNLHILSKTSYSEANKSCLVASSEGEKLYSLLMQSICMDHCGDDVPISKAQNTFRKRNLLHQSMHVLDVAKRASSSIYLCACNILTGFRKHLQRRSFFGNSASCHSAASVTHVTVFSE